MLINLVNSESVDHQRVGGKAYNLHSLRSAGFLVPPAVVVSVDPNNDVQGQLDNINFDSFLHPDKQYAVRSSGVGEDSDDKSWAGIFDSYLFVKPEDVIERVKNVLQFSKTERYQMYASQKDSEITSMAVVIQEMVHANYAGVAFTTNPIEGDPRICLIEVVEGVGESLVSGEKTPATLRINKVTGISRIQQVGHDQIPENILNQICEKLMPLIEGIEKLYGKAMDVEWAMHYDEIYILQARPITSI